MAWGGFILTNAGRNLLAKVQAGTIAELNITRFGIGDGNYSGSFSTIANLVSQRQSVPLRAKKAKDQYVNIEGYFSNEGLAEGFYFREWGIFAMNGAQEILYAYDNAGADAEYIAPDGSIRYEKLLKAALAIAADVNITINTSGAIYVTAEELEERFLNISSNAADISIEDTAGHFASENVEGALVELYQNKASLEGGKVPASLLPDMDYLSLTGDSKNNKVTFTEAVADADIASGDTHATLFGKILKNLNTLRDSIYNIVNGGTTVGKAVTLNGLLSSIAELNFVKGVTSAIQTQLNGKAPTSHANAGSTYGLGSPTLHGHVKTINALTQASHVDGTALSAFQGKILNDKIGWKLLKTQVVTLVNSQYVNVPINLTNYDFIYIKCLASGTLNKTGGNWGYILAGPYNAFISGSGSSTSAGRVIMAQAGSGNATGLSADGGVIGIVDKLDNIFHSTSGMGENSGKSIGTFEGVSISSYYIEGTATIEIYGLER